MRLIALLALLPTTLSAHGLIELTGAEIEAVIADSTLTYDDGAVQRFFATGQTRYDGLWTSWGTWTVRDDSYCSKWSTLGSWDCYRVYGAHDAVLFLSNSGEATVGVFAQ